ncbi:GNAT family N-acetyltransferase [Intrasporangium sp. DVR]|uniref:GNAT family N-acetyltransferase n=1 Tax=Intrasporangium sp. DVR TaxID=3127867 RepID=UPI00333E6FE5
MTGSARNHPTDRTQVTDPSARLTEGSRVVVRRRLVGREVTDVIGHLAGRTEELLLIDTATGRVEVPRGEVVAAKPIPPRPTRPGPAHLRISIDDLALLGAQGWVAVEQAPLGSWLLRSAPGYTGRANSVLVVGDPGQSLDEAVDEAVEHCERWYADRGQRTMFQVNGRTGFAVPDDPVGARLLERGYVAGGGRHDWDRVFVMTGPSSGIPAPAPDAPPVEVGDTLTEEWLLAYSEGRTPVPGITEAVLTGSEQQLFLSVRDEESGRLIAVTRLALHTGWAGVFGLWVHPEHRRRGLARAVMAAAGRIAREGRMPAIYLQVSGDNDPAIRFYEGLGFTVHHEYTYLVQPPA